jgi:hypothetical protein
VANVIEIIYQFRKWTMRRHAKIHSKHCGSIWYHFYLEAHQSIRPNSRPNSSLRIFLGATIGAFLILELLLHVPPLGDSLGSQERSHCQLPPVRREWRALNTGERREFIRAVNCLSTVPSSWTFNGTLYDDFTYLHGSIGSWCWFMRVLSSYSF